MRSPAISLPRLINYPMKTRKSLYGAKKRQNPQTDKRCRDCARSYDWHSKALDGHLILCRCKVDAGTEFGKWCKFLHDYACEKFVQRKEDGDEQV